MAVNKPRCPMNFKQFCGSQCAWFNGDAQRCQMLEEHSELANVYGRLVVSVNDIKRTIDTLVEPLKGLTKERKNDLRR
jgi:hypothetical protein